MAKAGHARVVADVARRLVGNEGEGGAETGEEDAPALDPEEPLIAPGRGLPLPHHQVDDPGRACAELLPKRGGPLAHGAFAVVGVTPQQAEASKAEG